MDAEAVDLGWENNRVVDEAILQASTNAAPTTAVEDDEQHD